MEQSLEWWRFVGFKLLLLFVELGAKDKLDFGWDNYNFIDIDVEKDIYKIVIIV